ncbi:MAG: glutamate 5-kinase [Pirellulaceae bacterium]|nr:glutamate 5-kinase [Pirellulaceae bacterium]
MTASIPHAETDLLRQEIATSAHTLVVKVGTRVLTQADGTLHQERIDLLADELNAIRQTGRRVVLVSSGAVGAGVSQLGLPGRPRDLARLQAVAAVGQTRLIEAYDRTFRKHGTHAAQVLLTADDLDHRTRYLNVRNTLLTLLEFGVVPVINENDTVAVDELMATFGDNDRLAAMITNLLRAPLLVILSDVEGLYDGDPRSGQASLIHTVRQIDERILSLVRDQRTGLSKGGMASKLEAARITTASGENVIIASGRRPGVLADILAGRQVGTLVLAQGKSLTPRKRWIGYSAQPCGSLLLDAGAVRAVTRQGRSLLAIGITAISGEFRKGDIVRLCSAGGREVARGLTNYASAELQKIRGLKSDQIEEVLGHRPYEEVIHCDNLLALDQAEAHDGRA